MMLAAVLCGLLLASAVPGGWAQNLTTEEVEEKNNCKCVLYYQCNDNNEIITNGEGIIDIRFGADIERIKCPEQTKFCCKENTTSTTTGTTTGTGTDVVTTTTTIRPPKPLPREPPIHTTIINVTCGIQRPALDVRFQSEDDITSTLEGEFPWAAAIFRNDKFRCTGALIHPKVVLTVAHYVQKSDLKRYKVVVNGKTYLEGSKPEDERSVVHVIRHPKFYSGGLYNDIALLILNEPYTYTPTGALINEVCVPPTDSDFNGQICIAAGWNNLGKTPLKKVILPVIPHDECQKSLREKTDLGEEFDLDSSFTCAGGVKGADACSGDGGSPLMCPVDDVHYVVGLVSWGKKCGLEGVPGVYTDVRRFTGWIKDELSKLDIEL